MERSITAVYQDFIWQDKEHELADKLYNNPPKTFSAVVDRFPKLRESYRESQWFEEEHFNKLGAAIQKANDSLHALTDRVSLSIDRLENGAIEAAHQSVVIGGPCYILNKAATAVSLATLAQEREIESAPFFFVADYDIVQTELTNIRTPIMGMDGNLISIPVPEGYEHSPVSQIPLGESEFIYDIEESIRSSYRPMFKDLERTARILVEERLEQALSIIRWAFFKADNLGDWALLILARVFNIESNLGIPIIPASNPQTKKFMRKGMEFLLSKDIRETFLKVHEESTALIKNSGFRPGIGDRLDDFVPFYYECPNDECHRSRTELVYQKEGAKALLIGTCPSCKQKLEIEVAANTPDLSAIEDYLSPRVDTRQIMIDMALPVLAHVGGAGETAYYAQVIPIANELSIPFPTFVKYPRVYFNTPWNEHQGKALAEKGISVLHRSELFKIIGRINKARRKNRPDDMNASLMEFHEYLLETHRLTNEARIAMKSTDEKRDPDLTETILQLERYLSWTFGQYAEEKFGQEASWSWIEWALNSSFRDLFGPYERAHSPELKNGSTMFINFSV